MIFSPAVRRPVQDFLEVFVFEGILTITVLHKER